MSPPGRTSAQRARVRVERLIGRADGARLTIDRLQFDLSQADLVQLAAQLLRLLPGTRKRLRESEPHTIGLDPPTVENDPVGRFRGGRP